MKILDKPMIKWLLLTSLSLFIFWLLGPQNLLDPDGYANLLNARHNRFWSGLGLGRVGLSFTFSADFEL